MNPWPRTTPLFRPLFSWIYRVFVCHEQCIRLLLCGLTYSLTLMIITFATDRALSISNRALSLRPDLLTKFNVNGKKNVPMAFADSGWLRQTDATNFIAASDRLQRYSQNFDLEKKRPAAVQNTSRHQQWLSTLAICKKPEALLLWRSQQQSVSGPQWPAVWPCHSVKSAHCPHKTFPSEVIGQGRNEGKSG